MRHEKPKAEFKTPVKPQSMKNVIQNNLTVKAQRSVPLTSVPVKVTSVVQKPFRPNTQSRLSVSQQQKQRSESIFKSPSPAPILSKKMIAYQTDAKQSTPNIMQKRTLSKTNP